MSEIVNLVTQFDEIVANNPNYKIIWIKNNKKEIVASTLVDSIYYDEIVKNGTVSLDRDGYAKFCQRNPKRGFRLHRYIYYHLKNNIDCKGEPDINHINNNRLDNTVNNLEDVTPSENAQNRKKTVNATSPCHGVSFDRKNSRWMCSIKYKGISHCFSYSMENHAAYHYNLLVEELDIKRKKINNISEPEGFVRKEKKNRDLPTGVTPKNGKYLARCQDKQIGVYDTAEEAEREYLNYKQNYKLKIIEIKRNAEIIRNENGYAIILLYNKFRDIVGVAIVDDDDYKNLIIGRWHINNKYATGFLEGRRYTMHRFILNYFGDDVVDHINGNRFDNRKENLRIVTVSENSQNRGATQNSSSPHVGVYWNKSCKKWRAEIGINGKGIYLGQFENEEDAARARDVAKRKYHTIGRFNFNE